MPVSYTHLDVYKRQIFLPIWSAVSFYLHKRIHINDNWFYTTITLTRLQRSTTTVLIKVMESRFTPVNSGDNSHNTILKKLIPLFKNVCSLSRKFNKAYLPYHEQQFSEIIIGCNPCSTSSIDANNKVNKECSINVEFSSFYTSMFL